MKTIQDFLSLGFSQSDAETMVAALQAKAAKEADEIRKQETAAIMGKLREVVSSQIPALRAMAGRVKDAKPNFIKVTIHLDEVDPVRGGTLINVYASRMDKSLNDFKAEQEAQKAEKEAQKAAQFEALVSKIMVATGLTREACEKIAKTQLKAEKAKA